VDHLRQCIRLNLDGAGLGDITGDAASRRTGLNVEVIRAEVQACEMACRICAEARER